MENAGAVAGKRGPVGMGGLRILPRHQFPFAIDGDGRREEKALGRQIAHPDLIGLSGLVITQRNGLAHAKRGQDLFRMAL